MKKIDQLKKFFEQASVGEIKVYTPEGKNLHFKGLEVGMSCDLMIKDWAILDMIAKRGDIGLGEAYHMDLWESSNLSDFLTYCSINLKKIKNQGNGVFLNRCIFYFYNQIIRLNTKYGSKKNILSHYDIGNEFYTLWLDSTMTYSSGLRTSSEDSLEQAQFNKYNRIIKNLDLEGKNVLEIGCGWGGFSDYAKKLGAEMTGITISDKQYHFAKNKFGDQLNILLKDYREIANTFDSIVSIEMFEAVGEKYWPTYFEKVKKALIKNGRAMIQTITIDNHDFENYKMGGDYIRHYVFPGGMLPSQARFCAEAKKAKLTVVDIFEFGADYAWTLNEWKKNFNLNREKMLKMNYTSAFLRGWDFYLSMCIAAFTSRKTNVMQVELINEGM